MVAYAVSRGQPAMTGRRWSARLLGVLLIAGIVGGWWLGSTTSMAHGGGTPVAVSIAGFAFAPQDLSIDVGQMVRWTNADAATHTATSTGGPTSFDSGTLSTAATFDFTFDLAGAYAYRCSFHASMTGTITVRAAATPSPTPSPTPLASPTPPGTPSPTPPGTPVGSAPASPASSGGTLPDGGMASGADSPFTAVLWGTLLIALGGLALANLRRRAG